MKYNNLNPYKAPVSEEVKVDGHLHDLPFSQLGAKQGNATIMYQGNSEDPDNARANDFSFNLWDNE